MRRPPPVALPGGHFALQAGDQELLVGPGLGTGPFDQPRNGLPQRRGAFERGAGTRPRRSGPGRWRRPARWSWSGWSCHPSIDSRLGRARSGVVVTERADLHVVDRCRAQQPDPRNSAAPWPPRHRSAMLIVWCLAQTCPWSATRPSQNTRTRARPRLARGRRPGRRRTPGPAPGRRGRRPCGRPITAGVHRVVVAVQPDVVVAGQPGRAPPTGHRSDRRQRQHPRPTAEIRSRRCAAPARASGALQRLAAGHGDAIGDYPTALPEHPLSWTKIRKGYALLGLVNTSGATARSRRRQRTWSTSRSTSP